MYDIILSNSRDDDMPGSFNSSPQAVLLFIFVITLPILFFLVIGSINAKRRDHVYKRCNNHQAVLQIARGFGIILDGKPLFKYSNLAKNYFSTSYIELDEGIHQIEGFFETRIRKSSKSKLLNTNKTSFEFYLEAGFIYELSLSTETDGFITYIPTTIHDYRKKVDLEYYFGIKYAYRF